VTEDPRAAAADERSIFARAQSEEVAKSARAGIESAVMSATEAVPAAAPEHQEQMRQLAAAVAEKNTRDAVELLLPQPDGVIEDVLELLSPAQRQAVLAAIPGHRRQLVLANAAPENRRQWLQNDSYPEESIGRLMDAPLAVFHEKTTIAEATQMLRALVTKTFVTYLWAVDDAERFVGVVVMREMLLGRPEQTLGEIMIPNPFFLQPEMSIGDAMKVSVTKHFPVYPVCDAQRRLVGTVRGTVLFEAQAFELSAQAGSMVGVEKEERLSTHWTRSLKFRHPWLQLNLLTAFVAAAVVGLFEHTLAKVVLLAVFLPVLAGQSGNTGCQALAVTLRGITLGELTPEKAGALVGKEALLGFFNGMLVGISAGLGMLVYAMIQKHPSAWMLAGITWLAMIGSCVISGISGALVPLTLKKLGADPATASSIFLTTATDVVSMGTFLGLATLLI
jgi:magnesium transporter